MNSKQKLISGNKQFCANLPQSAAYTAMHGQQPYAAIVTCSDSRTAPELIFNAEIGDLFVVRTAGNVVSDFDIALCRI